MGNLLLFASTLVVALWLQYVIRKTNRLSKKSLDSYLSRENKANHVRRVDISHLDYLKIEPNELPASDHDDPSLKSYRDTIENLSKKEILNLTGISNTDLKLQYGVANLPKLSECDNNYIILVRTLQKWGERLYSMNYPSEAITVLEYAVRCKTDAKKTYRLLAKIYQEQNQEEKIQDLIQALSNVRIQNKNQFILELKELK